MRSGVGRIRGAVVNTKMAEVDRPGNGDDRAGISRSGNQRDCGVGRRNAVDLLTVCGLVVGHGAEDRSEQHARSVDVDQVFVDFDATARGAFVRDTRSLDCVVSSKAVERDGRGAEGDMDIAANVVVALARIGRRKAGGKAGGGEWRESYQAKLLVDFEIVGAEVEAML